MSIVNIRAFNNISSVLQWEDKKDDSERSWLCCTLCHYQIITLQLLFASSQEMIMMWLPRLRPVWHQSFGFSVCPQCLECFRLSDGAVATRDNRLLAGVGSGVSSSNPCRCMLCGWFMPSCASCNQGPEQYCVEYRKLTFNGIDWPGSRSICGGFSRKWPDEISLWQKSRGVGPVGLCGIALSRHTTRGLLSANGQVKNWNKHWVVCLGGLAINPKLEKGPYVNIALFTLAPGKVRVPIDWCGRSGHFNWPKSE